MEIIVTGIAELSYVEEDIIYVKLLPDLDIDIDLEKSQENFLAVKKLTQGKRYAALTDGRVAVTITKEAMAYGATPEANEKLIAQAIVVTSLANRLIGNFIIKFHKPSSPTKLFSSPENALIWLRKHVKADKKSSNHLIRKES